MKRVQLFIAVVALSVAFGFLLALSQSEPAKAEQWHPDCNFECFHTWCSSDTCRMPGGVPGELGNKYFSGYADWEDLECVGWYNCNWDDIGCGPICTLPDPPPDTL